MDRNLERLLKECEKKQTGRTAFLYRQNGKVREVPFEQFCRDIERMRQYYEDRPESRIGLLGYNSYEWLCSAIAMLSAGKTVIFLDVNLSIRQLLYLCSSTDAELLAADEEMFEERDKFPIPAVCFKKIEQKGSDPADRQGGERCRDKTGRFLYFTSGTSKSAKAVVASTEKLYSSVHAFEEVLSREQGKKCYLPLPYYHIFAFVNSFCILYNGGTNCIGQMGRYLREDLEVMQPQALLCAPAVLEYMVKQDVFPKSLQTVYSGGSGLGQRLAEQVADKNVTLYNAYGTSETVGGIACSTKEKGYQWLKPLAGVRFIRGKDNELGVVLSYHMEGYYRKPEETEKVLIREQNLYWTGDVCEMDSDGYVKLLGRVRDLIVLENGEKVHAEDTDEDLSALDGVREAAVIGIDGRLIAAVVLNGAGQEETVRKALREYNRDRPAAFRISELWVCKNALPRTQIGKLKRAALEQEYMQRSHEAAGDGCAG